MTQNYRLCRAFEFLDAKGQALSNSAMNNAVHPRSILEAAELLRQGRICAFPTETVYGLGADATNPDAVLKIYEAKKRPRFNPLIVHCADRAMAERFVTIPERLRPLAEIFWPGPLTLVLPIKPQCGIADLVTAGLDTLGVRIPGHTLARQLITEAGCPVAAPSANPSGKISPTTAEQVRLAFDDRVPVLDGGPCEAGLESTILTLDGDRIVQLRAGALARNEIEAVIGEEIAVATGEGKVSAPGMLKSHYAPHAPLRLNAEMPQPGEAYLALGEAPDFDGEMENLSATGDLREAARNLFAMLHRLDAVGANRIAVAPIPSTGLGEAINDRLKRAAAPRDG